MVVEVLLLLVVVAVLWVHTASVGVARQKKTADLCCLGGLRQTATVWSSEASKTVDMQLMV